MAARTRLWQLVSEMRRRRATSTLLEFTLATYLGYNAGWFHIQLSAKLDQVLRDVLGNRRPRVIITAPPQHGKSELVSRRFPAYALGISPELGLIATTYNADRAGTFSTEVQRVLRSDSYGWLFPRTRIPDNSTKSYQATKHYWDIVGHGGFYRAAGVGGGITGSRADILIIDDPIKDDKAANSPVVRQSIWNWFVSTAYTRVRDGGGIVIVTTRWHEDDLVGRLLVGQVGDKWELVSFQAIAEQDEPPYRVAGDPLCVERFSLESLEAIRRTMGTHKFASLYQQHPMPAEGGIIKPEWIQYFLEHELPDHFDEILISFDCAFKDTEGSDFVAGHVWGRAGSRFYLLDRVHARMDCPATMAAIRSMSARWPEATVKLVEAKANGPAVVQMLAHEIPGLIAVEPQGGKQSRMYSVSALFEARNVYVPHASLEPKIADVVSEWVSFPHGTHDDDCDAMSQALLRLKLHPDLGPPPFTIG